MKGGLICDVISGKRTGLYAMAPNSAQKPEFEAVNKVAVEYYHDALAQKPLIENGIPVKSITSISNLRVRGFYD